MKNKTIKENLFHPLKKTFTPDILMSDSL